MSPVIYAAVYTAFVLLTEGLERTEKKYAYVIGQEIYHCQKHYLRLANYAREKEYCEGSVKEYPEQHYSPCLYVFLVYEPQKLIARVALDRNVIRAAYLSGSHRHYPRRENVQEH